MTQLDLFASPPPDGAADTPVGRDAAGDLRRSVLAMALQLAVPFWVERTQGWPDDGLRAGVLGRWRDDALDVVAHGGDNILYIGSRRGDTAKSFNALAKGMAALAHHRGGYVAFGLVWCARHSPGGALPDGPSCPACISEESTSD